MHKTREQVFFSKERIFDGGITQIACIKPFVFLMRDGKTGKKIIEKTDKNHSNLIPGFCFGKRMETKKVIAKSNPPKTCMATTGSACCALAYV